MYDVIIDMKGYLYLKDFLDLTNLDAYLSDETLNDKLVIEKGNITTAIADIEKYNVELQALLDTNNTNISEGFREYEHLARQYKIYSSNLDNAIKRAKLTWLTEEDDELIVQKNYQITTIKVGAKFELKNIVFDFGKATLRDESKVELDKLYDIMDRSDVIIELGGHSDNVGSDESNKKLSQQRVNSVREYLVSKGIESGRIAAVGYGEERPVATNETDAGRQRNRRVEVQITDIRPREGSDILTAEELKKKEAAAQQFDLLSTLQYASKIGGLPKGSPCSDKIGFLYGDKKPKTTTSKSASGEYVSMEDYIFQEKTIRLANFGYSKDTYSGGLIGVQYISNEDVDNEFFMKFHGELYPLGLGDSVKFQLGGGVMAAYQTMNMTSLPLFILGGVNTNLVFINKLRGIDGGNTKSLAMMLHIPIGAQYIYKYNDDITIAPELTYNIGLFKNKLHGAKSGYLGIGANAKWKFVQGGLFINLGSHVKYFGLRAGVTF